MAEEQPEWLKWTKDRDVKFWAELSALAEEDKCQLLNDTPEGRIYMPHFYPELIKKYYQNLDDNADIPFPSEESLKIEIPENQLRYFGVGSGLVSYLEEPQETELPIIRIGFSDDFGSALILADMIPRRLIEAALLKIRTYLRAHGNRDYAYHKLNPQLAGKEAYLRDTLNQILTRPSDCYSAIENGSDFSYLFWAHFSILVKGDIKKKKDPLSEDIAAVQAMYILEAMSAYYKSLAAKQREKEMALKDLEVHLKKPPYFYTLEQIIKFTSSKGVLLLSQYTREELEAWLKKETTESTGDLLPSLLVVKENGEPLFVSKSKLLFLCARFLGESREKVKKAVIKHWVRLLKEYRREPAMDNDRDFDQLLVQYTQKNSPVLASLLEDPKLQLVYDEMEQSQSEIPLAAKIFSRGELLPYSALFLLKRRDILDDAKILLPFWFSIPVLSAVVAFFKNLFNKKKNSRASGNISEIEEDEDAALVSEREGYRERLNAAKEIEVTILPPGHTIDTYLEELEGRWSRLIDKQARANLVEDVNSLIRDNLRRTLRIQKHYRITRENLAQLAANIVSRTPSLQNIGAKDSLRMYMELYLVKLLENMKF
jgi:hypothetical protein